MTEAWVGGERGQGTFRSDGYIEWDLGQRMSPHAVHGKVDICWIE